jgi:mRNA-degrading endonuclease RelE of RelBE toxin-antitoxin system
MPHQPKFELIFAPETVDHLDAIERRFHRLIQKTINEQLTYTPERETRNRKPVEQPSPFGATWELRFGPNNCFRVFYEVDNNEYTVQVLAIGVKDRNQLFIGGEEFEL